MSENESSTAAEEELLFNSRRSPFLCRNGCVASSQPLASSIGLDLLRQGANAADAAIAVGAALCVLEPCSTGLGGDMFSLFYDNKEKKVFCINGSGCSPEKLTLEMLQQEFPVPQKDQDNDEDNEHRKTTTSPSSGRIDEDKFMHSHHAITVPGAAKGYEDLYRRHGSKKFTFLELLTPAIKLAEEGFPVSPITSYHWRKGIRNMRKWYDSNGNSCNDSHVSCSEDFPLSGNGPTPGEIVTNKDMGRVLRDLGIHGAMNGFYTGTTGKAIIEAVREYGGVMEVNDLTRQQSLFPEAIYAQYRDVKLWQIPPNGQGIAACVALAGMQHLEQTNILQENDGGVGKSANMYHAMIEMMRLGFKDARSFVSCPENTTDPHSKVEWLLDQTRIKTRVDNVFDTNNAVVQGAPESNKLCGTVSFQVVDSDGNAISFVNSNYMGFGTGVVPKKCGFTLHNRGFGFDLNVNGGNHPNLFGPKKRPYHTIIPGMLTYADGERDELYATISNMGDFMQPQGHLQLTVNMQLLAEEQKKKYQQCADNAPPPDPQWIIDMPRFRILDGTHNGMLYMEEGFDNDVIKELKRRGHQMKTNISGHERKIFGRAQIIYRDRNNGCLWAGSDGRSDGCAMGY